MRTPSRVLLFAVLLSGAGTALAASSGAPSMPQMRMPEQRSPEQQAATAYNDGVRAVKKADKAAAEAAKATGGKQEKLAKRAKEGYSRALGKFEDAVALVPALFEAWNYIGYTKRNLGDYEGALQAYDRTLSLSPGYAQAIEYRGQAYLKLSRLEDAKNAYLQLYAGNRELSNQLLAAMREWVGAQRAGTPADPAALEDFAKWVDERAAIAGQTAALTREGTAASWN